MKLEEFTTCGLNHFLDLSYQYCCQIQFKTSQWQLEGVLIDLHLSIDSLANMARIGTMWKTDSWKFLVSMLFVSLNQKPVESLQNCCKIGMSMAGVVFSCFTNY